MPDGGAGTDLFLTLRQPGRHTGLRSADPPRPAVRVSARPPASAVRRWPRSTPVHLLSARGDRGDLAVHSVAALSGPARRGRPPAEPLPRLRRRAGPPLAATVPPWASRRRRGPVGGAGRLEAAAVAALVPRHGRPWCRRPPVPPARRWPRPDQLHRDAVSVAGGRRSACIDPAGARRCSRPRPVGGHAPLGTHANPDAAAHPATSTPDGPGLRGDVPPRPRRRRESSPPHHPGPRWATHWSWSAAMVWNVHVHVDDVGAALGGGHGHQERSRPQAHRCSGFAGRSSARRQSSQTGRPGPGRRGRRGRRRAGGALQRPAVRRVVPLEDRRPPI